MLSAIYDSIYAQLVNLCPKNLEKLGKLALSRFVQNSKAFKFFDIIPLNFQDRLAFGIFEKNFNKSLASKYRIFPGKFQNLAAIFF